MSAMSGVMRRRGGRGRRPQYRRRFGLPADAARPLDGPAWRSLAPSGALSAPVRVVASDPTPAALCLYQPGLSVGRRLLARLGTPGSVTVGLPPRPMSTKGLAAAAAGALAGMMLGQLFDAVTFAAPLYGLVLGAGAGGVGWRAVRGRWSAVVAVEAWRAELDAMARILANADRLGQPFVSPPALRRALHGALWEVVTGSDEPGHGAVAAAFDAELAALDEALEAAVVEVQAPAVAQRRAAVTERLAVVVAELERLGPTEPIGGVPPT